MPHTHTSEGEIDFTVSAHIVRLDGDQPKLFLHKHKKFASWMPASGHIELTELPLEAALREMTEETGYLPDQVSIYQPKSRLKGLTGATLQPQNIQINNHPIPDSSVENHSHSDIGFVFATLEGPTQKPAQGESEEFETFNFQDLELLDESQILKNVREIGQFILTDIVDEWDLVKLHDYLRNSG